MSESSDVVRVRRLILEDKVFETKLYISSVTIITGTAKRPKEKSKDFDDFSSAREWVLTQERKKLRQGFMIENKDAQPGEPTLVMSLANTYTGMLPISSYTGGLLTAYMDKVTQADVVLDIEDTKAFEVIKLPPASVSRIVETGDSVYLLSAHQVFRFGSDETVSQLTQMGQYPVSVLETDGNNIIWYDQTELVVTNLVTGDKIWTRPVEPSLYGGHSRQLAVDISETYVAFAYEPEKIEIYNFLTGLEHTIDIDVQMVQHLLIVGNRLYVSEIYDNWGVYCYDISTGEPVKSWNPIQERKLYSMAVSFDNNYLAVGNGTGASIFELESHKKVNQITLDYVVKNSELAWTDDNQLALREDSGFLSVYKIFNKKEREPEL